MNHADAYAGLMAHLRQTAALSGVAGLLNWDQEAVMPPGGAEQRAEQAGAMSAVLHERRSDPRIAEWLDAIDPASLDDAGRANVREARRYHDHAVMIPKELAEATAKATARAHRLWAQARADDDVPAFLPALTEIIGLVRERAQFVAADGQSSYDALLDEFEPGTSASEISAIFARLRAGLTELRQRIADKPREIPTLTGSFARAGQLALAEELAKRFGYDEQSGRIDLVVHPFCSGTRGDVRITTRVDEADPFNCLYSTVHETGHALYEQGLDPALAWQPAGNHVSMGVHESQSRFCENQIGRSRAFCGWLYPRMVDAFGDFGIADADTFYATVNRVAPGYIRTEADEVHYNLHIMLRFELEQALIAGHLAPADLEAAWNDRFAADFGVAVDKPSNGVLQDVHWSAGLFGYFPTYTLGNIYAGCLDAAMRRDLGDVDTEIAGGDTTRPIAWMREKIHRPGAIHLPVELITRATGSAPTEQPLLDYLNAKFGALYDL
ncbi:MAG: carboxypeptidase M32 [Pseudomonadota bacterium]